LTSVGLADGSTAPIYTISGSPLTSNGTLTFTLSNQTANKVFAGPTTGSAQPTFRALVAADIPAVTNIAGGAAGSLPFQSASATTTYLSIGTAGYYLTVNAGATAPQWTALPTIPTGSNPSATIGLSAVNGTSTHFMTSDSAPALSQSIAPTWTGNHIFTPASGVGIVVNSVASTEAIDINSPANSSAYVGWKVNGTVVGYTGFVGAANNFVGGSATGDFVIRATSGAIRFSVNGGTSSAVVISTTGTVAVSGALGVNGATPPTQVTGFGTPTGNSVVANFSGTAATTAQIQATIAEILTVLKAAGIIGA
jgi:hypothetical protein